MSAAIEVKNLSKMFDGYMLDNVSFTLPRGCVMGFIGENGAGKSVTIKLILDLLKKDRGYVKVMGETLTTDSKKLKEHIGVVMDECCFPEMLNGNDVNRIMKGCYSTWDEEKYFGLLKQFDISVSKAIKDYSRGMTMKLSIAVSLSHDSHLLILDEATSGLDPVVRDEILDVFLEFMQDENHSIFISSHIISDLEKICDYITFIHKGKLLFTEEKDELTEKYGLLKCSKAQIEELDHEAIVGTRMNQFGVEALVIRDMVPDVLTIDTPSIEDIMVYYVKGMTK